MRRNTILLAIAGAALATPAWAGTVDIPVQASGGFSVPVASLKEIRHRTTVRQQFDFSCGSAAVSTLLTHHYGHAIAEDAVFTEMFDRGDPVRIREAGFSLLDLKLFLEARGFTADGFHAPLERLESVGIPAIVMLRENGYSHFVVVKGVRHGRVLIGDPAVGTRVMTRAVFESLRVDDILFIVSNAVHLARFNQPADWRAAPLAPVVDGVERSGVGNSVLSRHGPSDF